ncbi:MAG: GNAT family N-acetyltransferase [Bacteroides sp.]|nr:GNAT family N-acetyltransferase [Bacteroides sp.]
MEELRIELYRPEYKEDFVRLNSAWIETFFHLESSDRIVLNDPEGTILDKGGQIFFAVTPAGEVVGCCALIHNTWAGCYELAKMAVVPRYQGKGAGRLLGKAVVKYARGKGIPKLFLEGNTRLVASIALYQKLGFKEVPLTYAAYERCDIRMELELVP